MTLTNSNKNPFDVLHSVTQQTFDKISATDTRVLNRRLKRVFDMSELSDLSNSIISNILVDLAEFKTQFEWVNDYYQEQEGDQAAKEYFFPLVMSIQDLLKELGTMKMTLNDLQADYVKRIERLTTIQHISSSSSLYHQPSTTTLVLLPSTKQEEFQQHQEPRPPSKSFMQGLLSLFTLH